MNDDKELQIQFPKGEKKTIQESNICARDHSS